MGDRIWLDFSVGMKLIWFLPGWWQLSCFLNAGRKSLAYVIVRAWKLTCILRGWSKLTWLQCGGSNLILPQCRMNWIWLCGLSELTEFQRLVDPHCFGFGVTVENDLFLASGSKLNGILCRGIEIDLILEWGSKLTWFQRWSRNSRFYVRDRNWLGFSVGIELDFYFVRGSRSTSVLCAGRKLLGLIYGSKWT